MVHPHHRIHEPIALAALFACSVTLHGAWIANLFLVRIPSLASSLVRLPALGPISGLYTLMGGTYLTLFVLTAFWFRGRDCTPAREGVFWFFVSSVIAFTLLTLPSVYEFSLR